MTRTCLVFAGALALSLSASAQDALSLLKKMDEGFTALFERVAPMVVVIEVTKDPDREAAPEGGSDLPLKDGNEPHKGLRERGWKPPEAGQSEGSGFIVRSNGYILTNLHVVDGAESLEVRTYAGKRFPAKMVGSDPKTDIAVIKVEATDLPAAILGDSDALRVGQLVCAIGAPFSQDYSFSCGWVSGKGRTDLLARSSPKLLYEDYIQTDAFINPGNSGGPLFDVEGRIIGMNTLINGLGRGLAFAIPSNLFRDVADQIINTGTVRRPWLGVRITSLVDNKGLREQVGGLETGVVVNTVEAGAPAYKSDLQPGDIVTAVDGRELRTAHDLVRHVQTKRIGDTLQFSVLRGGQQLKIPVLTGEQPADVNRLAIPRPVPLPAIFPENLGMKLSDGEGGAKIVDIAPDTPASRADLRAADIVTGINTETVASAVAARDLIAAALGKDPKKGVLVNFLRKGKKSWAVVEHPGP